MLYSGNGLFRKRCLAEFTLSFRTVRDDSSRILMSALMREILPENTIQETQTEPLPVLGRD
jgi:hypothetical protein